MSNIDNQLDAIVDAHVRYLEGDGPAPDLSTLAPELRDEALARVQLLEASWGAVLEVPSEDPVARRFGFDRAGQTITVNGRRVAQLRKATGMEFDTLLGLVTAAGGDITAAILFRLEQNSSADVAQPTASAIVAALQTTLADIETTTTSTATDPVRLFLSSPRFAEIIDDWAYRFGRLASEVRITVTKRVLAVQYRAEDVTDEHLTEIVQTILHSLEP
jgi:hypothetical protein